MVAWYFLFGTTIRAPLQTFYSCVFQHLGRGNGTDSPDWNKQFIVLSISRSYLHSIGIHPEQVARLTDEDMTRIAEVLIAHHFDSEFDEEVVFTARLVLAEKRSQ